MSSNTKLQATQPRSPQTKRPTSSASEMLTPSEIQSLRQSVKETSAYAKKAFAHLRPKV